ncbi:MAG TPA: 30S ribosomal protein S12 methylthiotransferase RimO [Clostridiales bacterium]|nr:30S ribosomal protein S12 methylthiotransferase RimO [Clostridiales bacterium]
MTKEELLKKKFHIVQLGCDKNRVDGEKIAYLLQNYGLKQTANPEDAEIIIVNTCAFIKSAKEESIDCICSAIDCKSDKCEKLIVTGCFAQRYYDEAKTGFPEVDAVVRLKNNEQIVNVVKGLYGLDTTQNDCAKLSALKRSLSTPSHYAYLKIADGCNNCCAYCTIPKIRGRFTSVPVEELYKEAKALVKNGVKELILVAQDVTNYGTDIYGEPKLVELIQTLSKIKKLKWIRLHYCYPNLITDRLLNEIVNNKKVCKYLDIPMQHASSEILRAMNRRDTLEAYNELLKKIHNLPRFVAIRSTFIVGFPGETNKDFETLKEFLERQKLQYVGFFKYSREEYTAAYIMPKQVNEKVKDERLAEVQELQEKIMIKSQKQFIGHTTLCILEKIDDDGTLTLRNQYNSPSVDSLVFAQKGNKKVKVGEFYNVKITGLYGIDLAGEIV